MQTETSTNENFKFEVGEERAFVVTGEPQYYPRFNDVSFKIHGTAELVFIKEINSKRLTPNQLIVLRQTSEPVPSNDMKSDGSLVPIEHTYYWEIVE